MLGVFAEFERSIIRARRAPERKGVRPGPRYLPSERTGDGLSVGRDRLRSPVMSDPAERATAPQIELVPQGWRGCRFCRERPRSRPLYRSSGRCPLSQRPASPKTTSSEVGVQHPPEGRNGTRGAHGHSEEALKGLTTIIVLLYFSNLMPLKQQDCVKSCLALKLRCR
jgi:hypothetical protein